MANTVEERLNALEQQVMTLTTALATARRDLMNSQREALPVGSISAFAGPATEEVRQRLWEKGWLLCDGDSYTQKEWPELFGVIRQFWGRGKGGDTDFSVPNLEGLFLRGVTSDPHKADLEGRVPLGEGVPLQVGSIQMDAFKDHSHDYTFFAYEQNGNSPHIPTGDPWSYDPVPFDTTGANQGASTETRPRNAYVQYIIKAGRHVVQEA
jgi:microcystin-dependent protein